MNDFMTKVMNKVFGDPHEKIVKSYRPKVDAINELEPQISELSDDALVAKTTEFKDRLTKGETLDDLLVEAFAVVREAGKRVLSMRHFDVQLIGGMILHYGQIAEMKTGEGKTLVSTLAAYLNALEGKGVYVVTVNDYLAKRDSEWMGQIYTFLGLTVGLIQSGMSPEERMAAYAADITYGTNNEFGFDYLRDNLAGDITMCCQTRRHYAIIDEVDSILIDEARTPLIISGPIKDSTSKYAGVAKVIKRLEKEKHFTIEEKHKNAILTEEGIEFIEKEMSIKDIYSVENMDVAHMAVQCLKALYLFAKDVDYVVKDGEVVIVDEFTGRLMEGRRYSDGLHQAIEAVEGLDIREENQTLASITFQNYFRLFPKLSGMTGTAKTEAEEFENIYGLFVAVVPTHKPMVREDMADMIYKSKFEKFKAIAEEIKEVHKKKQPVLVGTISIENSEQLSALLQKEGIPHNVLNAKFHEKEADIISAAGQPGSVTIATNMAGRGTDIKLGPDVEELGGLYVIGSERHESRRIDNQLRGRSGRQGDPGKSRFYVALDDELMRLFGSDRIIKVMDTLGVPDDTPIEHGMISRSIEKAQAKVEKYHYGIRKQILQFDDVLNKQRETIYAIRRQILSKRNLPGLVKDFVTRVVDSTVVEFGGVEGLKIQDNRTAFTDKLKSVFPVNNLQDVIEQKKTLEEISKQLIDVGCQMYAQKAKSLMPGLFDEVVTKRVALMTLDRHWIDHLNNMETLREGIGLRAYGQRDPLIEYKREGFDMFSDFLLGVSEEALSVIYRAVLVDPQQAQAREKEIEEAEQKELRENLEYNLTSKGEKDSGSSESGSSKVGRNDLCPCGSGKKYKKCCMK